jgi:hypothetical protein
MQITFVSIIALEIIWTSASHATSCKNGIWELHNGASVYVWWKSR